ncbi:hypothetical protein [Haloglycomyces albus]|uniref:hypothetical protein n=1 Tax=Haloglycomyces albus TaxID=526067 RepID=UPI00046D1F9A|nr:hypothetical protein [Haloglycomyces albus]
MTADGPFQIPAYHTIDQGSGDEDDSTPDDGQSSRPYVGRHRRRQPLWYRMMTRRMSNSADPHDSQLRRELVVEA